MDDRIVVTQRFVSSFVSFLLFFFKAGEILTLPVVVLTSLLPQPRMFQAMAQDGLLPPIFSRIDRHGNLRDGVLISGIGMTVFATFIPFHYLNEFISGGVLLAYAITNWCLVLLRCVPPSTRPRLLSDSLLLFNFLCFVTGLSFSRSAPMWMQGLLSMSTIVTFLFMWYTCPRTTNFGGAIFQTDDSDSSDHYETPFVPLLPCVGMFVNWFLIAQMSNAGLAMLSTYIIGVTAIYASCCGRYQEEVIGWRRQTYEPIADVVLDGTPVSVENAVKT